MRRLLPPLTVLALVACLVAPLAALTAPLSSRIENARDKVRAKRGKEGVLSSTVARYNGRIERLQGEIRGIAERQARIQGRLDRTRAELADLRERLTRARQRLARLRRELEVAEGVLGARLVEMYKTDEPDALTVILESDGFADLLERTEFLERISAQDRRIVLRVRRLKAETTRQAKALAVLEGRTEAAVVAIRARRDEVRAARARTARARDELQRTRDARRLALSRVRSSRVRLEGDLRELEAEQARVRQALLAAQRRQALADAARARTRAASRAGGGGSGGGSGGASGGGGGSGGGGAAPAPGPIRQGSGALIWPVSGSLVSPFGMRWGRLHAGVDIAVPSGTPIRAADSGRVVLLGVVGGYGNYTCIQHTSSLSTCYAHQSAYATSQGASVRQGQVIGYVGCTGHCFGDHLHFETRVSGSPVNPMGYL